MVKTYFLEKNKNNIINLSSAELAQSMAKSGKAFLYVMLSSVVHVPERPENNVSTVFKYMVTFYALHTVF